MTPEERKAAADQMRAEIEADRASRPVKQEAPRDLYAGSAPASATPAPAPAQPAPGSVESEINEIYARSGGYLRGHPNQSTDHMN